MLFGLETEFVETRDQRRKTRGDDDDFSVQRVDRLDITIHSQIADQTIRRDTFASRDDAREIRRASACDKFVRLRCRHKLRNDPSTAPPSSPQPNRSFRRKSPGPLHPSGAGTSTTVRDDAPYDAG